MTYKGVVPHFFLEKEMRRRTRQRTPYQTLLLEHIESLLDMTALAHDKYIISCLDETGSISLNQLCYQKDLLFLRASVPDLSAAISSSLWLGQYYTPSPIPKLKLPCNIYQNSLIIYDLPDTTFHKAINKYTKKVIPMGTKYEVKRHKEGLLIDFSNKEDLICFWRTLDYCLIKGTPMKAMILIKKTPQQYRTMIRSQSVVFSKPKPTTNKTKKEKKEARVIEIKDNNFPPLK